MSVLKVGYDVFAGASQAGTNDGTPGVVQAEVTESKAYYMQITRLSDDNYWNNTTKAFQAGEPAQADEIVMQGSQPCYGSFNAHRRLMDRIPYEALIASTAAGNTVKVYPDGDKASGVTITLAYDLDG